MSSKLWYNQYVDKWMHALPLGNGRVGAMFYGNPQREVIEINEESLWSGRRIQEKNRATPEILARIRELIFEERLQEAVQLSRQTFLADPPRVRFYESMGEVFVDFADQSEYTDYHKELELSEAVASATWKKGNTTYSSECFVSEAYDALIYRVETDGERFSCNVTMKRKQDAYTSALSKDVLVLNGRVTYSDDPDCGAGDEGMGFGARIKVITDGTLEQRSEEHRDYIGVTDATYVEVYGAFATNYNVETFDIDESIDYRAALRACMDKLEGVKYEEIKATHLKDHAAWFSNVRFELEAPDYSDEPTDVRLAKVKSHEREDLDLYTLYYNFGRYLLIESSGKNATLPANLQGIWCHDFRPPWSADYHTNINLQMNYWPADSSNCSDTVKPLVHFVKMLSHFGKRTVQSLFGADGWTVNHCTDIFGRTGVHNCGQCGFFPMAGPWMCLSLWEHYEFTNDLDVLKEIYPILKGSCQFVCDYLVEDANGWLVTNPTNSPENSFYYTEPNGERRYSMFTHGATMDCEIIHALFTRVAYACEHLGVDADFAKKLTETVKRLPPLRVSERYGTICEWIKDYEETEPGHRHISHMFGLYPGDQINETDPVIYEAAKKTVNRRLTFGEANTGWGCNDVGWSQGWMINFCARLKDAEEAGARVKGLLTYCTANNLFDTCLSPSLFQIDGNFGGTAGINEMLIQSHLGEPGQRIVELLPALPSVWRTGSICGVKSRGGFMFDIAWKEGKLTQVTITATSEDMLRLKLPAYQLNPTANVAYAVKDSVLSYPCKKNETVTLRFS